MKTTGIFFLIGLLMASCSYTEKKLIGTYAPTDYKNTFDTIQLKEHNVYHRKVYDINKKLVLEMDGKWKIDGSSVKFKPFYLNLDDDLVRFPQNVQDTTGGWGGDIYENIVKLEFCVGHSSASLPDQNCYRKIKNQEENNAIKNAAPTHTYFPRCRSLNNK